MTEHQLTSLEHGASVNLVVTLPQGTTRQQLLDFKEVFTEEHAGPANADKPLFLTGGADVTLVGSNMQQLDFKAIRGAGETRIAMAAGIHPVVLGSSEGMQGSSLNAGNYGAAKRATGDVTIRDLWAELCGSLATLLPEQDPGVELWYDESDVAFLRDDQTDQADISFREAQTMRTLIDAGYSPESVVAAVRAADWSLLRHSGLYSVQLQPPGTEQPASEPSGAAPAGGGEGGDGVGPAVE
jgi:phage portal protein BeeE